MAIKREVTLNPKLQPFWEKPKPLKIVVGGRMSGKTLGISDMLALTRATKGHDLYCLREYLDAIEDSVHRSLVDSVQKRLCLPGWKITDTYLQAPSGAVTTYRGANRNPNSIQGAENYRRSWFSEAHTASQASIDKLLPTILRRPDAECWFDANPQSSNDPFSKRFILPYLDQLNETGYFEDDLHIIIKMNWRDNIWWTPDMDKLRIWDYEHLDRAKYNWIWEGDFYDAVDNALIKTEWFNACIDAHEKLGIQPRGGKFASHDPSGGDDNKSYAMRHGIVVMRVEDIRVGAAEEGAHWACQQAINDKVDHYTWDADGMGAPLAEQTTRDLKDTRISITMFKGSEKCDHPKAMFQSASGAVYGMRPTEDVVKIKRNQYYLKLREAIYLTYRAVEHKEYVDPDKLISFSSKITTLTKLRSELCRIPVKLDASNGMFELYGKRDMKNQFKLKSPNLADAVMMLMRTVVPDNALNQPTNPYAFYGNQVPQAIAGSAASRRSFAQRTYR